MPIEIPIELLPVPKTLFEFTFAVIGWQLGNAFSKHDNIGFDEALMAEGFWSKVGGFAKFLVKRTLHFLHHYWMGLLLMVFCVPVNWPNPLWWQGALYWLGYGLFIEDAQFHVREKLRNSRWLRST